MTTNIEELEKLKAGLEEVERAMDTLNDQAKQDRITYRSQPEEGLRRAVTRTEFLKEIQAVAKDDTLTIEEKLNSYRNILLKYGLRSN